MELNMRTVRYYETVLDTGLTKEESADIIVPDLFPDIMRIVDASGLVAVKEKNAWDARAEVSGVVRAVVLYVPESARGLKKIDVSLPFTHTFENQGITPESKILAKAALLTAEARAVNPRKVQVTVGVQLDVTVYALAEWGLCEDLTDAKAHSAHLLKSAERAFMPVAAQCKEFTVSDELEVPGSRPPVLEILKADARLVTQEVKFIGNKLIFKGSALLRMLYAGPPANQPADEICLWEQEIPYSQILETESLEEGGEAAVDIRLTALDLDLRPGLSGEARLLGVTLQLEAQAVSVAERKLEAVVDVYSTAYDVLPEFRAYQIVRRLDRSTRRQTVRESLETGQPVSSVVDAQITLWPVQHRQEDGTIELSAEALAKVVYLGDDQQFYTLQRHLPVALGWESGGNAQIKATAALAGEVLASGTHDGIELRFAVDFDVTLSENGQFSALGAVSV
ncbi:MAG: DUF3794 domain-containing protein, partial [Oscillospiraceae bacterium]|nr:DUF3794 domain-containing protein [Oscillospiraceae bacterium]